MKKIISISIVLFFIFFLLFQKKEVNASYNLYRHYVTCPCGYESHVQGVGPLPNGYYKCLYCKGFMDGGSIHNNIEQPYSESCHE